MKKLLSILFCLAFAAGAAEAKTYYVDATRPNNNGNGLKVSTAKKTIQAAVNIAAAGDTILVYPGTYPAIKTNNKKITIKSVKGSSTTKIVRPNNDSEVVIAHLGKQTSYWWDISGKNTSLVGFLIDGKNICNYRQTMGVGGGQLKSCVLQRVIGSGADIAGEATLTGCIIRNNSDGGISSSILNRCKVTGNEGCSFWGGRLANCLVTDNKGWGCADSDDSMGSLFNETVVVNCTLFKNCSWYSSGEKPLVAYKSKFYNCILRNNYHRLKNHGNSGWLYGKIVIHNADTAKTYANIYYQTFTDNRDPKFTNPDNGVFTLKTGSGCINKGKLTDTLKKYAGTLDLAGKTRVRGSVIDLGCYEY